MDSAVIVVVILQKQLVTINKATETQNKLIKNKLYTEAYNITHINYRRIHGGQAVQKTGS